MRILFFTTLLCYGILITVTSSIPISKVLESDARGIADKGPVRKRSTNADIGLNGSRMANMNDLLRRYMLLTILENVKGKRSWKRRDDGSLDYEHITGAILRHKTAKHPWYVVDMKRDIHPEEDPESSKNFGEITLDSSRNPLGLTEDRLDASNGEDRSATDNFEFAVPKESFRSGSLMYDERPEDQSNDNAQINLLDLLSSS